MASISDLAPEILSSIAEYANCEPNLMCTLLKDASYCKVSNLSTPSIRNLCLVSRNFYAASIPVLYRRVVATVRLVLLFERAEKYPRENQGIALFRSHTKDVTVNLELDLSLLTCFLSSLPRLERVRWAIKPSYYPRQSILNSTVSLEKITGMLSWPKTYSLNLCCHKHIDALSMQPCISTSSRLKVLHLIGLPRAREFPNILIEGRMPPLEKLVVEGLKWDCSSDQANAIWDFSTLDHLEVRASSIIEFLSCIPTGRISCLRTFITDGHSSRINYTETTKLISKFLGGIRGLEHLELRCSIRDLDMSIFKKHGDTLRFLGVHDYLRDDTRLRKFAQLDPESLRFIGRTCPWLMEIQFDMAIEAHVSPKSRLHGPLLRKTACRSNRPGGFDNYWESFLQWESNKILDNLCRFRNLRRLTLCVWVFHREIREPAPSSARDPAQRLVGILISAKEGVPFEQIHVHTAFWPSSSDPSNFSDPPTLFDRKRDESVHYIYDVEPRPTATAADISLTEVKIYS